MKISKKIPVLNLFNVVVHYDDGNAEPDRSHGSPFDRGSADSWYRRGRNPHKYPNGTYNAPLVEEKDLTEAEINEYNAGYDENEASGGHKEWD